MDSCDRVICKSLAQCQLGWASAPHNPVKYKCLDNVWILHFMPLLDSYSRQMARNELREMD